MGSQTGDVSLPNMTRERTRRLRGRVTCSLLCLLLVLGPMTAPAAVATPPKQDTGAAILNVSITGSGTAARTNETVYVWASNVTDQMVLVSSRGEPGRELELCTSVQDVNVTSGSNMTSGSNATDDPPTRYRSCVKQSDQNTTSAFNLTSYEDPTPGTKRVVVTMTDGNRTVAETNRSLHVIVPDGDIDNDRLTNVRELELGTDLATSDTDGDGLSDGAEILDYGTNATAPDTDGDGARDAVEINQGTNATVQDTDGDGLFDGEETELGTNPTKADTDGDGLEDGEEANRYATDPTEADTDVDGIDDAREVELGTDPTEADTDGDGIDDATELVWGTNPTFWFPMWLIGVVLVVLVAGLVAVAWVNRDAILSDDGEEDAEPSSPAANSEPDEPAELLSDRERILQLLDTYDGQVKQSAIVEETGWSKATVSRKLTAMEEDGEINRFRIGRENVVTRGEEPADRPT